jgi:hypothetical protein
MRVAPKDRVRDVNEVVRIEGNVNVSEFVFQTPDHLCQALHVLLSAGHIQSAAFRIAKVDLRVDN